VKAGSSASAPLRLSAGVDAEESAAAGEAPAADL
jgi:hypothetical protein